MMENKKAVFFDLDHTLWDFEKNSAMAFGNVLKKHVSSVPLENFLELYVPVNIKYWKLFRDEKITKEELRYGRLKEVFDALGYTVDDITINLLAAEYIQQLPNYNYLYDGAIEVLDYLKTKYSLHIITNGFSEVQAGKIKNANIGHYFTTITNSEMAGCKKPNPKIFEYALQTANVQKAESVMIGDCIEADVQGALDCGIDAIYFNESKKAVNATIFQVSHLLQLKDLL